MKKQETKPDVSKPLKKYLTFFFFMFLSCAALSYASYNKSKLMNKTTLGSVVTIEKKTLTTVGSNDRPYGKLFFYPKIEFVATDKKKYEFTAKVPSHFPEYSVGQQVKVIYSENDPNNVRLARTKGWSIWKFMVVPSLIFLVAFLFGLGLLIFGQNKRTT